jgi:hypothetical protein
MEVAMRAGLAGLFLPVLLLAQEADSPQTVVDKAIQARGGEKQLAQSKAVEVKVHGHIYRPDATFAFVATIYSQLPDQYKHVMDYQKDGESITQIQVYSGKHVWLKVGNNLRGLEAPLMEALQRGRYAESLTQLTILKDKAYTLTSLGDFKVGDSQAEGVLVTAGKNLPVKLFFDKATGHLAKTEHRQMDPQSLEEITQESYYTDYRIPDTTAADEAILQNAKIDAQGPALLKYLRKTKANGVEPDHIRALIRQLGDDSFEVREKATQALLALGEAAVPFLNQAVKSTDLEIVSRAERCLRAVQKDPAQRQREGYVWIAIARTLARKKVAGAVEALLEFLPQAANPEVEREVRFALTLLARPDGRPDPTLVKALEDKDARRRQAAAEALGRSPPSPGSRLFLPDVKYPMHGSTFRDGRKFMEWDVREVVFLNQIDAKEFVKP